MKTLLLALTTLALLSCKKDDLPSDCVEKTNPNVVCMMQYNPVCGYNGKTILLLPEG